MRKSNWIISPGIGMKIKNVWVATQISYSPKKTIWIHPRLVIYFGAVDFCWVEIFEHFSCQLFGSRIVEVRDPCFFSSNGSSDISQTAPEWDWNLYICMAEKLMVGFHVAETYASPILRIWEMLEATAWCFLSNKNPWKDRSWFFHKDRFDFRDENVNQLFLYVRQFGYGTNDMVFTWENFILQNRTTKSRPMLFLGVPIYIYIYFLNRFPTVKVRENERLFLWDEGMIPSIFTESTCLLVRGEKLTRSVGI